VIEIYGSGYLLVATQQARAYAAGCPELTEADVASRCDRASDNADEQHTANGEQYGCASKRFYELPTEPNHPNPPVLDAWCRAVQPGSSPAR
jgi:hypothetical protein